MLQTVNKLNIIAEDNLELIRRFRKIKINGY
jgi:hypothetical protein